jgi:hypothetical protein
MKHRKLWPEEPTSAFCSECTFLDLPNNSQKYLLCHVFFIYDESNCQDSLCFITFQWLNNYGTKQYKKQAGYGVQSHASPAMMDVAQPLSSDAKVHLLCFMLHSNVTQHA